MSAVPASAERDERSEARRVWLIALVPAAIGLLVAAQFVAPPPPRELVLAAGAADGSYTAFGHELAREMAAHGLTIQVRETAGSVENVALLAAAEVDLAFVQGGILAEGDAAPVEDPIVSLASLFYEPLWIFHRAATPLTSLADLAGLRVAVGVAGSGTRPVATTLARANGVTAADARFVEMPTGEAARRLVTGELDVLFAVAPLGTPAVQQLLHAPDEVVLFEVARHLAYERTFRSLRHVVLARGQVDLAADLPPTDVDLLAPVASLVSRDGLHAALVPVLIDAARHVFGAGGSFSAPGEFPSAHHVDAPLNRYARQAHAGGLSFLYQWLPFRVAATLDRLKILLLPLLTLLFPLVKLAPPVYRWRIRSKIYRWYRLLRELEAAAEHAEDVEQRAQVAERMAAVEREIEEVVVPASYMDEFYALKMHVDRMRQRFDEAGAPAAES